jgi:membrane protein implicated in regulation of membrane protease activity
LAKAIIGGLSVSVVLTVFLVPAAFLMVYRRRERRDREHDPLNAPQAQQIETYAEPEHVS